MKKPDALTCPQCGAPIDIAGRRCSFCGVKLRIEDLASTLEIQNELLSKILDLYDRLPSTPSLEVLLSKGIGYLRLGRYEHACQTLEMAVDLDPCCADAYYYQAVALLNGQRPRGKSITTIRKIEGLLSTAIQLQGSKPDYYFFLAAVKLDFYRSNGLREGQPDAKKLISGYLAYKNDSKEIDAVLHMVSLSRGQVFSLLGDQNEVL